MASNQIASGSVVLSANADQMITGFQKASKATEQFAKKMRQDLKAAAHGGESFRASLGKDFAQEMGRRTFAGGVLGGLAGGGLAGGLSEAIANSASGLIDMATNAREWRKEFEIGVILSNELSRSMERFRERHGISIPTAEKELSGYVGMAKSARNEIERLKDLDSGEGWRDWIFMRHGDKIKAFENDMNRAESSASKLRETLSKLRHEELERKKLAALPFTQRKEAKDYISALDEIKRKQDQIDMTPDEKMLDDLRRKGTPQNLLDNIKMEQEMLRQLERNKAEKEKFAGFGLIGQALQDPEAWGGKIRPAAAKPLDELAGAVEAGTKEAYSLSVKNQFSDEGIKQNRIHEQNGKKLDTLIDSVNDAAKQIMSAFGKLGVV